MNVSAVQQERGPRSSRNAVKVKVSMQQQQEEEEMNIFKRKKSSLNETMNHDDGDDGADDCGNKREKEMLIQILLTCLKQAQHNECFQSISKMQQNVILRHVWSELFVLKASHWPIDITSALRKSFQSSTGTKDGNNRRTCEKDDGHLMDIINATKALNADLMELSLLEILILSRPEFAIDDVDGKEHSQLQFNMENAISRLALYVSCSTTARNSIELQQLQQQQQCRHYLHLSSGNILTTQDDGKISHHDATAALAATASIMRFGKLLLALRHLSIHFYESSLNNLFRDITEINFPQ